MTALAAFNYSRLHRQAQQSGAHPVYAHACGHARLHTGLRLRTPQAERLFFVSVREGNGSTRRAVARWRERAGCPAGAFHLRRLGCSIVRARHARLHFMEYACGSDDSGRAGLLSRLMNSGVYGDKCA